MHLISEDRSPARPLLLLMLLFLIVNLFFVGNNICLWDDDEAAYAGFALRMIETGDWVNPQFTWSDVHRKTPFHFWTIAVSYLIFGVNEFAVRFPSALAVLLTALSIYFISGKIWGQKTAAWSSIIFSTSFLSISMGKMSLTDAWLMFFDTLAVLSLLRFLDKPSWKWNLLLWSAVALGIMVKGPPIIILLGGFWLGLAILHPKRKNLIGTHPWIFGPLSLLPFVLWAYFSYMNDGGKLITFLYEWYIVKRVGGAVFGQSGPPGYHFVVAIVAFIPWLPFFLKGFWNALRFARRDEQHTSLFLWLLFGWGFYELMSSKLPSYAMGAHPAIAIAAAGILVKYLEADKNKEIAGWAWVLTGIFWILLGLGVWIGFYYTFPDNNSTIGFVAVPMIIGGIALIFVKLEQKVLISAFWGALTLTLLWGVGGQAFDAGSAKSSRKIVASMKMEAGRFTNPKELTAAFCGFSFRQLHMSFPFYTERSFKEIKELSVQEAIAEMNSGKPIIILVGEGAIPHLEYAIKQGSLKSLSYFKPAPEWRSLNDQLKVHPFSIMHNLEGRQ